MMYYKLYTHSLHIVKWVITLLMLMLESGLQQFPTKQSRLECLSYCFFSLTSLLSGFLTVYYSTFSVIKVEMTSAPETCSFGTSGCSSIHLRCPQSPALL